ncbi:Leucine Rich Repeat family protein expressed [Citrus sinensis]|nr:Leucine Rich Repeat family protein expressed [Citrus sinensis]
MSSKLFLLLQYIALFSVLLFQLEPRIADSNSIIIRCIDEEKEALLTFEQSPMDEYGALSSWGTEDDKINCCEWRGVCCNNTTSHFKVLNLRRSNDENARRKILKVPEFIGSLSKLRYLNLSCGGIPKFFGNSCSLNILRLPFNYLNGQLSELIQSLSGGCMVNSLESLYLGANDLTGPIPDFGGFSSLKELRLRENRLNGTINKSLSQLSKHESLTLGRNSFTVDILNIAFIFKELLATESFGSQEECIFCYLDTLQWTWKGSENEYENTLGLVKCLDLSNNNLCGAIPEEIMDVLGLIASNLSRNNLIGAIPPKIGQLKSLDFLDLSRNRFSGSIPSGLAQLSRLVYAGNLELCGLPLQNKCPDEESAPCPGIEDDANTPEDEDDQFITRILHELDSWFLCWILGVCGTLMLNQLLEWYERFALCDSSCEYCNTAKKVQELIKR